MQLWLYTASMTSAKASTHTNPYNSQIIARGARQVSESGGEVGRERVGGRKGRGRGNTVNRATSPAKGRAVASRPVPPWLPKTPHSPHTRTGDDRETHVFSQLKHVFSRDVYIYVCPWRLLQNIFSSKMIFYVL